MDVIVFVREAFERLEALRPTMLSKILDSLPFIKSPNVLRATLWIVGEYSQSLQSLNDAFNAAKFVARLFILICFMMH